MYMFIKVHIPINAHHTFIVILDIISFISSLISLSIWPPTPLSSVTVVSGNNTLTQGPHVEQRQCNELYAIVMKTTPTCYKTTPTNYLCANLCLSFGSHVIDPIVPNPSVGINPINANSIVRTKYIKINNNNKQQ